MLPDLISRYGASCPFNNELNNVWTNYYSVKEAALGPTVGGVKSSQGVLPRAETVKADLNTLFTNLDLLPGVFSAILTDLKTI